MKKWKQLVLSLTLALGLGAALVPVPQAGAINVVQQSCKASPGQAICKSKSDDALQMIKTALNTVLMVLGIVAVIMIIIGAFRYVTSAGEAKNIQSAKDTIMYAIIGLVVAILAFAVVNFVVGQF